MTDTIFSRNKLYWGEDFQEYLKSLKIAVFGLGGVGGFALEALARAGIGHFLIVDFDTALHSTIGLKKTEVFKKRLLDINPSIRVQVYDGFFSENVQNKVFSGEFVVDNTVAAGKGVDFIVDAIDTVKSKIELIKFSFENNIQAISSFGAGNRMDASKLFVSDISEIKDMGGGKDSFSKNVLHKLKKYAGIEKGLTVVSSSEKPHSEQKIKTVEHIEEDGGLSVEFTKFTPASTPVVPAVAGYLMADFILKTCYNKFFNKHP